MASLPIVTSNNQKFLAAQRVCSPLGVSLIQLTGHEIDEIQGEDSAIIAAHKANEAFKLIQKPLVITDDSWSIPALGGFPGAYMKSINYWWGTEEWLRLMRGVTDRRMILQQVVVYQDELEQVIFSVELEAIMLEEARGEIDKSPTQALTSFDGGKTTVAENFFGGKSSILEKKTVWHELADWLNENKPGQYAIEKS